MKVKLFIKSVVGFSSAAIIINKFWSYFPERFGLIGGWLSALILTGTMWYINHYKGMVSNKKDAAYVDMGLAIGLAIIVRDIINNGFTAAEGSIFTLIYVLIGGIIGGIAGGIFQKKYNDEVNEDAV